MIDLNAFLDLLFGVVFISQIGLISVRYPSRLRALGQSLGAAGANGRQGGSEASRDTSLQAYARANHVIAASGVVLLGGLLYLETTDHMTVVLLTVSLFFLLQLSPLALPGLRRIWPRLTSSSAQRSGLGADTYRSSRLLDVVGAVPVGIAAALFLSYCVFAGSVWGGELDTHLLKMVIFTSTQLLFAALILWSLFSLKQATTEQAEERFQILQRLAPLFVYLSIMISVYNFGKELLGAVDEPLLRPTMMSAFLQLLAALGFNALTAFTNVKRPSARRPA